jgi:hypothetical protein
MSDQPIVIPDQVAIPVEAARAIALEFGWDQIVVIARRVGGCEHVTTYGVDEANSKVAAIAGNALKRIMGWPDVECQAQPHHIGEHHWARAWRNRFIDERREHYRLAGDPFELATAKAEDDAQCFSRAFAEVMERRGI